MSYNILNVSENRFSEHSRRVVRIIGAGQLDKVGKILNTIPSQINELSNAAIKEKNSAKFKLAFSNLSHH